MKLPGHISLLFTMLTILLAGCNNRPADTDWPEQTIENKPWTRWWWMGNDVDSANLTYNLEMLSQAGIGGVEITPIYGVKGREKHYIDYLSPKWMNMLGFTLTEAARLGMGVDMNNGTGWPFGGPMVSVEDAATRALFREYSLSGGESLPEPVEVTEERQKAVARLEKLMAYSEEGEVLDLTNKVDEEGHLDWVAPKGKSWKIIALFVGKTGQKVKRAAPGGEGYVLDHLNKDAVSHYLERFDKAFAANGTPFPKTFFNDSYEVYGADWTPTLLDEFEKRRNYKLQDYLPDLLANGATDQSARVIADYRETVSELLMENFTIPWTEWAHGHGVKARDQAHGSPANLIDLYAAVDIPECESFGITDFDIPGLRKDSIRKENDSDPTILKYASSAAHITGKRYTSSETFTWLTEHFRTSLSQCKPEIDQMFASGVNRVFFHGTTYSPKEAAWPGWKFYASIDMSPTNPFWKDAPAFFNYITRVQSFLQSGQPDNDFLLYLPIYDTWYEQRGNFYLTFSIHEMRERLPNFLNVADKIMQSGFDLDYISDRFLQTTTVEKGLLKTEGGTTYKALILSAVEQMPLATMEQINRLIEQGATILFSEHYPSDVPGLSNLEERREQLRNLLSRLPQVESFENTGQYEMGKGTVITGSDYSSMLSLWDENREQFVHELGGQLVRRKHEKGHIYFLAMLQNNPVDGWVTLGVNAESAMLFDPMSGRKGVAALRNNNGRTEIYLQLKPGESMIIKTFNHPVQAEKWKYDQPADRALQLERGWQLSFIESKPAIEETFTLDSLISWTELGHEELQRNMGTGRYSLTFEIHKNPAAEYLLSLGDVRESAVVRINGEVADTLYAVPFETRIGSLLKEGENKIEIDVTNLPANRIADYDRRGVEWRIFHEINFVSITYQPTKFDIWEVVPSGLLGPVTISELKSD
ncbi:MAG TPA: glycosyl hydrolase family 2 [Porphyromonadaceae bacterium]|nr:glycosyl hydrolase family 2 [Porphyromonadaceae bacterium]